MNRYFTPAQYTPAEYVKPLPIDQLTRLGHEQQRQYENTVAKLEDQFTKITKFRSPSDIDTKTYHNEILSRVMPIAEEAARNPEFLRTPEGRGAMADVLRNTNYALLGNLETNRDQMLERLEQARKLDERGQYSEFFHGPKLDFQNYDTANQGILNRTTLTPYKSIDEILNPFLKEVQAVEFDELLSDHNDMFGNTMKKGKIDNPYETFYGVSNEQIQAATSRIAPTFLQTNAGQEHLAAWSYHIKKQNPGLSDQEVAQLAKERVITEIQQAGQKFVRVEKRVSDLGQWAIKASKSRGAGDNAEWIDATLNWIQRAGGIAAWHERDEVKSAMRDAKLNWLDTFEDLKATATDPDLKSRQQALINDYNTSKNTGFGLDKANWYYAQAAALGLMNPKVAMQASEQNAAGVAAEVARRIAENPAAYIAKAGVAIDKDVAAAYLTGGTDAGTLRFMPSGDTEKLVGFGFNEPNTFVSYTTLGQKGTFTNGHSQKMDDLRHAYLTDPEILASQNTSQYANWGVAAAKVGINAAVRFPGSGPIALKAASIIKATFFPEGDLGITVPENTPADQVEAVKADATLKKVSGLLDFVRVNMPAQIPVSSNGTFLKVDNGDIVLNNNTGQYDYKYKYALPSKAFVDETALETIMEKYKAQHPEVTLSTGNLIKLITGKRGEGDIFGIAEKVEGGFAYPDAQGNVITDSDKFTKKNYYAFNMLIPVDMGYAAATQASHVEDFKDYGTKERGEKLDMQQYYSNEESRRMYEQIISLQNNALKYR